MLILMIESGLHATAFCTQSSHAIAALIIDINTVGVLRKCDIQHPMLLVLNHPVIASKRPAYSPAKPHMLGFFRAYRMTTPSPTPDAWQRHITAWQHSGLSQKAYCQQHRLGLLTFHSKYRAIKNHLASGQPASSSCAS